MVFVKARDDIVSGIVAFSIDFVFLSTFSILNSKLSVILFTNRIRAGRRVALKEHRAPGAAKPILNTGFFSTILIILAYVMTLMSIGIGFSVRASSQNIYRTERTSTYAKLLPNGKDYTNELNVSIEDMRTSCVVASGDGVIYYASAEINNELLCLSPGRVRHPIPLYSQKAASSAFIAIESSEFLLGDNKIERTIIFTNSVGTQRSMEFLASDNRMMTCGSFGVAGRDIDRDVRDGFQCLFSKKEGENITTFQLQSTRGDSEWVGVLDPTLTISNLTEEHWINYHARVGSRLVSQGEAVAHNSFFALVESGIYDKISVDILDSQLSSSGTEISNWAIYLAVSMGILILVECAILIFSKKEINLNFNSITGLSSMLREEHEGVGFSNTVGTPALIGLTERASGSGKALHLGPVRGNEETTQLQDSSAQPNWA